MSRRGPPVLDNIVDRKEIDDLRRRLAEAEETIRAIRAGEVDGLIVDSDGSPRVFSLEGADSIYRAMVEQMREGAANIDPADGAILYCNPRLAEMVGRSQDQMVGSTIFAHVPSRQAGALAEFLADRSERSLELDLLRDDGGEVPVSAARSPFRLERTTICLVILTDLTQIKQLERRLVDAERLNAVAQLATGIAHELSQPLAAATIYLNSAKRLSRLPVDRRTASVEDTLDKAAAQITRAGRTINHLREFVARGEPDKTRQNMHEIIEQSLEFARAGAEDQNVCLSLHLRAADDLVIIDKIQIKQVLINLVRNAYQAMRSCATRRLVVCTCSTDVTLRVDIADTGCGLSSSIRARMFEPFTTTKTEGLGIGLSLCRAIIEAHSGRIWVEPNPGPEGGTIFRFALPLAAANAGREEERGHA
jgi:PAS domain S-box-containing protein